MAEIAVASASPALDRAPAIPVPLGLATLAKRAFDGDDLTALRSELIQRMIAEPENAAVLMDLSIVEQLTGDPADARALQYRALERSRLYRRPAAAKMPGLRLLAFMAPGDFMTNTPLEFLLEGSDVTLDLLYLLPGEPLPRDVPEHDLAFIAIGESEASQPLLRDLAEQLRRWPRPVLNGPERIARLSRDGAYALLRDAPGIAIPETRRIARAELAGLSGETLPLILRPLGSHAGEGLEKIEDATGIADYLRRNGGSEFYVAPFVDYRGPDGLFRKYRIALIAGRPYASHGAISAHWMIHYLNAGMRESAEKRAEEARWMETFDEDFARRHAGAFEALAERLNLDYFAIDCGETRDGKLLIFEADVAMIVHAMDPPALFPYKRPAMRKLFEAFRAMLGEKARR
jgi:glutathione synthase/RimK-type ligase-like ATP-grasp enzyme